MYLSYTKKASGTYAKAVSSTHVNGKSTKEFHAEIGLVVDREQKIFYTKERGYFVYDVKTDTYDKVPDTFVPPPRIDHRTHAPRAVDFGDAYLIDQLAWKSGFWDVIDAIPWGNKDMLHAMTVFYITSLLPNCFADDWYKTNIARYLYPKANMTSQGISDFLEKLGKPETILPYHEKYVAFIRDNYCPDTNVLIDSMGVPNKSHVIWTQTNVHNNKVSVEVRVMVVAQKNTGVLLFFRLLPGNINDASELLTTLEHCDALGLDVSECLMDAGFSTDVNLDHFYDDDHKCVIAYITRPHANSTYVKESVIALLGTLISAENIVQYKDRFIFIQRTEVKVGTKKNQPAYLYVGLDMSRFSDELHKLIKRAKTKNYDTEKFYKEMENLGIFSLLSGKEYETTDILPNYYLRVDIEQLNDISKNYTKLLPVRCYSSETFLGHCSLSMIATSFVRLIQVHMNDSEQYLGSRIQILRGQKAIFYESKIVPDVPMKNANDLYKAFKIVSPRKIPVENGVPHFERPKMVPHLFKVPKLKAEKTGKDSVESAIDSTEDAGAAAFKAMTKAAAREKAAKEEARAAKKKQKSSENLANAAIVNDATSPDASGNSDT